MSIKTDWISENLETVAKVKIPKTYISFNQFDPKYHTKRYLIIVAFFFLNFIYKNDKSFQNLTHLGAT